MSKELIISATPHETRVAILEEGQLCEVYVEREKEFALVGSIYKGRVTRVLPGMQSAFVEIGLDSDAFLYVTDFLEEIEEYDHIVSTVEEKVQKMEQQGGQVFASGERQSPALETGEGIPAPGSPEPSQAATPVGDTPERPAETAPPPASSYPTSRTSGYPSRGYGRGRGRRGRRGGQGRDRRQGRELPPSKYAPPRHYEPPSEEHEPVILPGESLAKYKGRVPAAPPAWVEEPRATPAASPPVAAPGAAMEERASPPSAPAEAPEPSFAAPVAEAVSPASEEAAQSRFAPYPSAEQPVPEVAAQPASAMHETSEDEEAAMAPGFDGEPISTPPPSEEPSEEEATPIFEPASDLKFDEWEVPESLSRGFEGTDEEEVPTEGGEGTEGEAVEAAGKASPDETAKGENERPARDEVPGAREPLPFTARIEDRVRSRFQRPMRRGERQRGGHHGRPQRHHEAARRPQLISEMLKAGQEIIAQIAKEPLGKKGARITSHVALPGRFLVYMPTVDHVGVSRKISSAEHRARLRRLVAEAKGSYPGGFIVRTAAEGASDEEIRSDVEYLGKTWSEIRARAEQRKAPALLHRDLNLIERILRDHLSPDFTAIWIDNEEEFSKVVEFVGRFQPQLVSRVKLFTKDVPIFEEFGIQQEIDKALRPKVWLKSGGYIVINHTEALVAIDVNTGKFVGKGSTRLEDTIVKTNLEAVKEIVRQIRLRDLGGIIVVDFIDMEERKNRVRVMQALEESLRDDKAPSKVLGFNEFGLVAITRKRTKQALERTLCQPCPYCTGSGMVKSIPTICYEIQTEARKMARELDSQSLTLRVNPEIAKALKTRESSLIEELEQWTRKSVVIQGDPTLHWEQYDIY